MPIALARGVRRRLRPRARFEDASRRLRQSTRARASRRPAESDTDLIRAVRAGDLDGVERLVRTPLDVNATNARGETALHVATALGHADIAACLLTYGADIEAPDAHGRTPLAAEHVAIEVLHATRQRYQRYRYPDVRDEQATDATVVRCAEALEADGIVRLGSIGPELLTQLRDDFEAIIADIDAKVARGEATYDHYDNEAYYWAEDLAYVSNNAFKHSAALARMSCSSPMVDIARLYLGKPSFIQRAVAMRYLPAESDGHHMFRYHHDLVDKRLKLMVLLTDVGENDQYMSYVKGSHALFHSYEMFKANACSLEYCAAHLGSIDVFTTQGSAGDVFLFDSNGAHKGNRRPGGRTRDAYFVEYSAAIAPQFGGDIPEEVLAEHPLVETNPLFVMARSPKRWESSPTRGSKPNWIVDLPEPSTWVWNPPGSPVRRARAM